MANQTQAYKRSLKGSIGAGMGSIFGSSGKTYYILEHKISSKYHKAGESQEIIVNQIELGRDTKCQVRFDESFSTVSRRHAAIVKVGEMWKLIQLSDTNSTLLNGKKIQKEWYLQNGDEIQLSVNGPKMGFIIPTGNKATVGSIGLSRRLSLFRQQALRPYKQAIIALSIILLLAVGGLTSYTLHQDNQHKKQIAEFKKEEAKKDSIYTARFENEKRESKKRENKIIFDFNKQIKEIKTKADSSVTIKPIDNKLIEACMPYVYFVVATKIELSFENESATQEGNWSGTGFLLNDGRFVTARHVVEPWYYFTSGGQINDRMLTLNKIVNNGGKVIAHFKAYSSSGDSFSFTNEYFTCNRSYDKEGVDDDNFVVKWPTVNSADWAYFKINKAGGLKFDGNASTSLERGIELAVLGFPLGIVGNNSTVTPQLSSGKTTAKGLTNGIIMTANTSYEQGNSGGPVFYTNPSKELVVIGIVSAGAGRSTGFIVPISSIN